MRSHAATLVSAVGDDKIFRTRTLSRKISFVLAAMTFAFNAVGLGAQGMAYAIERLGASFPEIRDLLNIGINELEAIPMIVVSGLYLGLRFSETLQERKRSTKLVAMYRAAGLLKPM